MSSTPDPADPVNKIARAVDQVLPGGTNFDGRVDVGDLGYAHTDLTAGSMAVSHQLSSDLDGLFNRNLSTVRGRAAAHAIVHELVHLAGDPAGPSDLDALRDPGVRFWEESLTELAAVMIADRVIDQLPLEPSQRAALQSTPAEVAYPIGALHANGLLSAITDDAADYEKLLTRLATARPGDKPGILADTVMTRAGADDPTGSARGGVIARLIDYGRTVALQEVAPGTPIIPQVAKAQRRTGVRKGLDLVGAAASVRPSAPGGFDPRTGQPPARRATVPGQHPQARRTRGAGTDVEGSER